MAASKWYFLFNEEDGSYNCHMEHPVPSFMVHEGLIERTLEIDPADYDDITLTFYDGVSEVLVDTSSSFTRFGSPKGEAVLADMLMEAKVSAERTESTQADIERFNSITFVARQHLSEDRVASIIADSKIDAAEAAEIQAAIDAMGRIQ